MRLFFCFMQLKSADTTVTEVNNELTNELINAHKEIIANSVILLSLTHDITYRKLDFWNYLQFPRLVYCYLLTRSKFWPLFFDHFRWILFSSQLPVLLASALLIFRAILLLNSQFRTAIPSKPLPFFLLQSFPNLLLCRCIQDMYPFPFSK